MKVFLLPLLLFVVSAQEECTTEFNDVVIVGGGMAGISAASRFNDYVLLESTNRIGGRMRSSQFSGYTIEEGANWITGSSVVSDLAEQYGLVTTPHDMYDMIAYDRNGAPIDINVYDESLERFRGALQDATKISEQLFEPNALVLDEGIVKLLRDVGWQPTSQIDQAVQWSSVDWEYAVSDASIRNFEGELPSMRLVVDQRGFEYIAQRFSQDFLDQSRLRLNTRVYKIEYDVLDTTYKARVFARTDSGCIEYQANNVILTVSVGVLNSGLIEFSPPLMYGGSNPFTIAQYVKVYFTFTENFWDDNEFIFTENEVGVCHQWQNLDLEGFLPGSRMLRCEIMTEAFESLLDPSTNELGDETLMSLLEPLRRTYGDLVQPVNSYYTKLHQDEDLGFGAYGFWRIGYGFRGKGSAWNVSTVEYL